MGKTCKLPENVKIHPKFSKFFGFCAVAGLISALIFEGSLSQDTEWIGLLFPFKGLGQPPLKHFHLGFAHMHSCPIMVFHVPQQFLLLVGLSQQPL